MRPVEVICDTALISILSPHARGDFVRHSAQREMHISIHSPHARGDVASAIEAANGATFQSTPLMRGETVVVRPEQVKAYHFNPLPSHEGRPLRR